MSTFLLVLAVVGMFGGGVVVAVLFVAWAEWRAARKADKIRGSWGDRTSQ